MQTFRNYYMKKIEVVLQINLDVVNVKNVNALIMNYKHVVQMNQQRSLSLVWLVVRIGSHNYNYE